MGEIVFLDVPYQDKDEAKRLGAKWSSAERKWYVPEGPWLELFARWLPEARKAGLQISPPIYVVESSSCCWSCGCETPVIALAADHLEGEEQEAEGEEGCLLLLSNVEYLPAELFHLLVPKYPFFRKRYSKTAGARYFMNHCSCAAPQGDFFLHSEPGGAFFPTSPEEVARIVLRQLPVAGPLRVEASCGQLYPDLISSGARRERFEAASPRAGRNERDEG